MKKKNAGYIATAILFFAVVAAVSFLLTDTESEWYMSLEKSPMQPPPIVFSVVWPVLYAMLAASFAVTLVKRQGSGSLSYVATGVGCCFWNYVFFTLHTVVGALFVIGALILTGVWMFVSGSRAAKAAAWLTVPYIAWLAFAFVLNFSTALLN